MTFFTVTTPSVGQTFSSTNGISLFTLQGETNIESTIVIDIYNNDVYSFDNDLKTLNKELTPNLIGDNIYSIAFIAKIPFEKGLYYMTIKKKITDEIIYVGKFYVR